MSGKSVITVGGQSLALPRGRLMFALDATASRESTWAIKGKPVPGLHRIWPDAVVRWSS
jgi:hypothetical protein